jgi:signal transduction histidine kinase
MQGMRREFLKYLFEMPLLWLGIAVLAGLIFIGDTITELEIAFAVLYVAVILLAVYSGRTGAIAMVGIACAALTVISYFLTRYGASQAGLINSILSLVAIGATTYLAIRIEMLDAKARQAQSELARMSRLMIVGELGTSIAHEVSQPITAIAANGNAALRWLSATPADNDEARRAIERIVADAGRAGDIIGRVRGLVARSSPSRDTIDLVEAINDVLELIRGEIRRNQILFRAELASDLPLVAGDRVQLQQVILNLVMNAIEALVDVDADARELLVSAAADERKVTVSVRDTGSGMPAEMRDRIFEAFYTTKPKGMGMGLAITRSIIEAHGGTVYAAPNFPHGAVFGFTLPLGGKAKG